MYKYEPTTCPICQGNVRYGKMSEFNIPAYQSGYCYYCEKCKAYVGTHKRNRRIALGVMADDETRYLRSKCHEEFDRHWEMTYQKNLCYSRLAKALEIRKDDCHFGFMDKDMLKKSLQIMSEWEVIR